MTLSIEIPEALMAQAETLGVPIETLVREKLNGVEQSTAQETTETLCRSAEARERAGASIREIQSRHTLGGLKIKDLIEEGRRL